VVVHNILVLIYLLFPALVSAAELSLRIVRRAVLLKVFLELLAESLVIRMLVVHEHEALMEFVSFATIPILWTSHCRSLAVQRSLCSLLGSTCFKFCHAFSASGR